MMANTVYIKTLQISVAMNDHQHGSTKKKKAHSLLICLSDAIFKTICEASKEQMSLNSNRRKYQYIINVLVLHIPLLPSFSPTVVIMLLQDWSWQIMAHRQNSVCCLFSHSPQDKNGCYIFKWLWRKKSKEK